MKKLLWLLLSVLLSSSAQAADLTLNDFAYGLKIAVPKNTAIAALSLPEQIYENAFRADLGDIRIFNAKGEPVPHMIRFAQTRSVPAPWQPLAFFPLPEKIKPESGGYRVYVRTEPDGAVVRIDPRPAQIPETPARTFLIDLSRAGRNLAQLRLEWRPEKSDRMAALAVDAGDDLVNWEPIAQRSAISDMHYDGRRLLNNTISLKQSPKRYLRLRQLDSGPAIPLIRIEGRAQPEGRTFVRTFLKIAGRSASDSPGVFHYRTGGTFPVDRVNLIFDQANSMADATVESRADPGATWHRRFKGLFYRIDVDSASLTGSPQTVAVSTDRHWRLTVDASDSTIGSTVPGLELGYRPHELLFIARGSGPFTLAFGSARAKPLEVKVAVLFDGISRRHEKDLKRWVIPDGTRIVLGGSRCLRPQPRPLPVRRIVLWSILVFGVLVVGVMAWRLTRRLKT